MFTTKLLGRSVALRIAGAAAVAAAVIVLLPASDAQACVAISLNEVKVKFKSGGDDNFCHEVNRDKTKTYPGKSITRLTVDIGGLEIGTCSIYVKKWGGNFDNYNGAWKVAELGGGGSVTKYFNASTHVDGVRLGC